MTEVDGPPVPALRFSSLLIRGAKRAASAGTDGRALEVDFNMAQAFEIPRGNRTAHHSRPAIRPVSHRGTSSNASRSPFPGRPSGWIDIPEYGPTFGPPQARNALLAPTRFPVRRSGQG
jgi:hypothetical protein